MTAALGETVSLCGSLGGRSGDITVFLVFAGGHAAHFPESGAETALRGKAAVKTDLLDGVSCAF